MRILTPDELRLAPMWHEAGHVMEPSEPFRLLPDRCDAVAHPASGNVVGLQA